MRLQRPPLFNARGSECRFGAATVRGRLSRGQAAASGAHRILALDLGKKRIGLALSDELGFTAQGLPTLHRTTIREDLRVLAKLAAEHGIAFFLLGNPLHMSGSEGRQVAYTKEFAGRLREFTGLPIEFWDERLTTAEAQRVLRESGVSIDRRAGAVDRMAAVLLLNSYLDALATGNVINGER